MTLQQTPDSSPSAVGSDGRQQRRARREEQLIEAALECVGTLGLRDTTVQDVAARADMAVGSISQYFDSKELLFTAVLRTLSEEFEATWQASLSDASDDPATRLRAFVDCYFEPSICQRKKVAVWFAFWGEVKARPQYRDVCAGYDQTHDRMLETLCAALDPGGHGGLDAHSAAKLIASACHGLWLELLTGVDGLRRLQLGRLARMQLAALYPGQADQFKGDSGKD
jgi:TetR/AcrR family transcriptional repressor of bet genes